MIDSEIDQLKTADALMENMSVPEQTTLMTQTFFKKQKKDIRDILSMALDHYYLNIINLPH